MTNKMLPNAGDCPGEWPQREDGKSPCGGCGHWVKPFRLVDLRGHLMPSLRLFSFLCDGCVRRLSVPGRYDQHRVIPVSTFVRGMPGSDATKRAHEIRARAKDDPSIERKL